jgi:undecaprenyl-diphosphatase
MEVANSLGRYSLARLSAAELCLVHGISRTASPPLARCLAIALSRLGNGWFYLALGTGCLFAVGVSAVPILTAGLLNALVLHCMYPLIKRRVARPRPYQSDPTLVPLLRVLSTPSPAATR